MSSSKLSNSDAKSTIVDSLKDSHLRVLVVEDNQTNQIITIKFLQRLGISADLATNGLEAVLAVGEKDYDVILMDCQMPEMDGFEATRRIRDRYKDKNIIIALTASVMNEAREKCFEAGMNDIITKPVTILEIQKVLKKFIPQISAAQISAPKSSSEKGPEIMVKVVNETYLLEGMAGSIDLMIDVIDSFLSQCPQLMDQIKDSIQESDYAKLYQAAHTLKGAASNFGTNDLIEKLQTLEDLGQSKSIEGASTIFYGVQIQIDRLMVDLQKIKAKNKLAA